MSGFIRQIYKSILPYESRLWLYKHRHLKDYEQLRTVVHHSPKGDFSLKPFDDHQCIFIHITKTAGTSVAKSLFGYLPYHYTACDYRVIYGRKIFNQYFKFAFVRNPWDRLYSAYRYLKAGGWDENDKIWAEAHLLQFESFNSFIKQWLTIDNINKHRHFWPQYRFICDAKGRPLINYLAYFETIDEDFRKICKILQIDASIGRHNANPGDNYRDVYDDEAQKIVADIYSRDIQLFGYSFDGIKDRNALSQGPASDNAVQI
mgnify:CR=1 FL=1